MSRVLTTASGPASKQPLYNKLRPRPNGPGRAAVARNQRVRLYGAMIEAVADHGYGGTTVTELTALAGISRRTFYEQFDNKETCFLRTYDLIVERTIAKVAKAWQDEHDWITQLQCSFEAFAEEIVDRPKAAKLAAVEALAAGPTGVARVERTSSIFERMVLAAFDRAPDGISLSPFAVKGIVGGLARVVRKRLLEDDVELLPGQVQELIDWSLQYRSRAAFEIPTMEVGANGSHAEWEQARPARLGLDGSPQAGSDELWRIRLMRCTAAIAARVGHAQLTVGQITELAGIDDELFHTHFESVDACFLAAVDLLASEALAMAVEASKLGRDWCESVYLGIAAVMRHVAEDRVFARVAFVEVFGTGAAGFGRRARLMQAFTELLATRAPSAAGLSEVTIEAIVGAVWQIAHHYVVRDVAHRLPGMAGHATYMVLAPLVGPDQAAASVISSCAAAQGDAR
jgi:AcrR family transcriptional regulator